MSATPSQTPTTFFRAHQLCDARHRKPHCTPQPYLTSSIMAPVQEGGNSLLHVERISQYVSLSPACLATPLPALCASIFSPLLLSYFPPARGVVLGYEDVQLSDSPPLQQNSSKSSSKSTSKSKPRSHPQPQDSDISDTESESDSIPEPLLLRHIDEYAAPFLWATASFLIWRPVKNALLTGRITHQSASHITLSHLNTFPVSVLAEHLPATWTWHSHESGKVKKGWDGRIADEGGWWVDEQGAKVEGGREIEVRIRDVDGRMDGKGRGKGFLRVEGSLVGEGEERERGLAVRGREKGKGKGKGVLRRERGVGDVEE